MKKAFEIKSKTFLQVSKVLSFRPKKNKLLSGKVICIHYTYFSNVS